MLRHITLVVGFLVVVAPSTLPLAAASPGQATVAAPPLEAPSGSPDLGQARRQAVAAAAADVDRLFQEFAERVHAPGMAWGIVLDGELVHRGFFGVRDVASRAAVDATTVFRIASMTKSFTALSILRLRDEGRLALDDPAEKYVPELRGLAYPTTDSPKITVRHLLSHAAGFPEDNPWGDRQLARTDAEMAAMLRGGIPFSTAPGTAYEYSNYGFSILGRIVANVSGTPYERYVAEHILAPLAMPSTTLQAAEVPGDRLAHGYRWQDGSWLDEPPLPHGAFGAMGGMLTSLTDLGRYVGFLMSAWPPRDDADTGPVRRASLREMQEVWRTRPATTRRDPDGALQLSSGGYGYGLGIRQTCDFGAIVSHTGGLPGYGSVMTWLPDYGVGVIGMANLTYTSGSAVASDALSLIVKRAGLRPRQPDPSPALLAARDGVNRLLARWDDALADSLAADNLFLDESKDRRRQAIETLLAGRGSCRPDAAFDVENALRGQWLLRCDKGDVLVGITLAPTAPPNVQYLSLRALAPGEPTRVPACRP